MNAEGGRVKNVLITGANRGIGLELTRLFAKQEKTTVFAACRNPTGAEELRRLAAEANGGVNIVELDVANPRSIELCIGELEGRAESLYALINNAGLYGGNVAQPLPQTALFGHLAMDEMLEVFRVNTIAPMLVAQACIGLLKRGVSPRIVNVSSDAGSIAMREGKGNYAYVASKAALNMMTRCLAGELREEKIVVVSMHPGFVRTDMGGPGAPMSVDETVPSLVRQINMLAMENSGEFINWDGKRIPW